MAHPFSRRRILAATASAGFVAGCTSVRDSDTPTETPEPTRDRVAVTVDRDCGSCAGTDITGENAFVSDTSGLVDAGIIHGTGGPMGDGDYSSRMFWAPTDAIDIDGWVAAASIGTSEFESGRTGRIYWNSDKKVVTDYLFVHERGHNLGFKHEDGGILSYSAPDAYEAKLSDVTKTIVEHTDGVTAVSWDEPDDAVVELLGAWTEGYITNDDLEYAYERHQDDPNGTEIFCTAYLREQLRNVDDEVSINTGGLYRGANRNGGTNSWR